MGKQAHLEDFKSVLARAHQVGVQKLMITAGCLEEVAKAVGLVQELRQTCPHMQFCTTVGVHPTRANELEGGGGSSEGGSGDGYIEQLLGFARRHRELGIRAIGEFGLDYNRIQYSAPEVQRPVFERQFVLAEQTRLPLFLHMRDAAADFVEIVGRKRHCFGDGVVHSFTGTAEEARAILDLDLFIGINGW